MSIATMSVKKLAEDKAVELIKNDLKSDDPMDADLCQRLEQFRSILKGQSAVDEAKIRTLLGAGLGMVPLTSGTGSVEADVRATLSSLVDKLEEMNKPGGALSFYRNFFS